MNKEHSTITQITVMERDNTWMNQLIPSICYSHLFQIFLSLLPPSHYLYELSPHDVVHNTHHQLSQSLCIENSDNQMNQSQALFRQYPTLYSHITNLFSLHRVISLWDLFVSRIIWSFLSKKCLRLSLTYSQNKLLHVHKADIAEDE